MKPALSSFCVQMPGFSFPARVQCSSDPTCLTSQDPLKLQQVLSLDILQAHDENIQVPHLNQLFVVALCMFLDINMEQTVVNVRESVFPHALIYRQWIAHESQHATVP